MRKFIIAFFFTLTSLAIFAQERNNHPYSIYGIGDINARGFGRNLGMGRSGIAMSSGQYLNNLNPASYHSMDSISFFFDFGLDANYVKYNTDNFTQRGHDMNIRNIAMGFRITRHWSSSIGIAPYSIVGYKIESEQTVEGTDDVYFATLTGEGGLNQFYWDHSYVLFNHLSLGVNFSYLFGNIKKLEQVHYQNFLYDIQTLQTARLNKIYADFGFQYFFTLNDKYKISMGGIFGNSHSLNFQLETSISQQDGTLFEQKILSEDPFNLPMYYGAGLSVEWDGKITFNADYIFNDWSSTRSDNPDFKYVNTNTFRTGIEYVPATGSQYNLISRMKYRIGYYYEDSYLEINKTSFADNGYSIGLGIPFLKNKTSLNISYNTGVHGTLTNGLIREKYHSITLNLLLHDWWFIKTKYD